MCARARPRSKAAVDAASMPHAQDRNNALDVIDHIDDAVVPGADSICRETGQLCAVFRARLAGERVDACFDAALSLRREREEALSRAWGDDDSVRFHPAASARLPEASSFLT